MRSHFEIPGVTTSTYLFGGHNLTRSKGLGILFFSPWCHVLLELVASILMRQSNNYTPQFSSLILGRREDSRFSFSYTKNISSQPLPCNFAVPSHSRLHRHSCISEVRLAHITCLASKVCGCITSGRLNYTCLIWLGSWTPATTHENLPQVTTGQRVK